MAKNQAKAKDTGRMHNNDFSIILGMKPVSDDDEKPIPEKKHPKKAVPLEERIKKEPVKKESLDDLLKKKEEIELFIHSLEDARTRSRMPEYTYERLKNKSEADKGNVEKKIGKMGYKHVEKESGNLSRQLSEIKESLKVMSKNNKAVDTDYNKMENPDYGRLGKLEADIDILNKKMQDFYKMLNTKIEKIAEDDDSEISENVRTLKKEIDSIRSVLSDFVRKTELNQLLIRSAVGTKPPKRRVSKMPVGKDVDIEDLSKFSGKNVVVDCSIRLFKSVERGDEKIFWYRIEDGTGNTILTSYTEIKAKKARVLGMVKATKSGSVYLLFDKLV